MQKVVLIFVIVITNLACSVIKKGGGHYDSYLISEFRDSLLYDVFKRNITQNNFYFQKVEIELKNKDKTQLILASIKFQKPDKFLVSIKSKTGIEALRIFISKDTILVNDRINRKLYSGSSNYLKNRFGFTNYLIPILLGDFLDQGDYCKSKVNCKEGFNDVDYIFDGINITSLINCTNKKVVSSTIRVISEKRDLYFEYENFKRFDYLMIAQSIFVEGLEEFGTIKIKIKKIEYPWNGNIDFIPGSKYEILNL